MLGSILARIGPPDIHAKDDIDMTTDDAIKYIQVSNNYINDLV
jgi:hypothetical protein